MQHEPVLEHNLDLSFSEGLLVRSDSFICVGMLLEIYKSHQVVRFEILLLAVAPAYYYRLPTQSGATPAQ